MAIATAPLAERQKLCAFCSTPTLTGPDTVLLCEFCYHRDCAPHCEACGHSLSQEIEENWSYQVVVEATVWGYEQVPFRHLCGECLDSGLRGEPCAQD